MKQVERLLDLMHRAWQGEAWHGPSLLEVLADVTAEQAAYQPGEVHSILELVGHIIVWKEVVTQRLLGIEAEPTDKEDWPEVLDKTELNWENTKERLRNAHEALCTAVNSLNDVDLEKPVPGWNYDTFVMLHGAIHHDLYHGGQIALLKKKL